MPFFHATFTVSCILYFILGQLVFKLLTQSPVLCILLFKTVFYLISKQTSVFALWLLFFTYDCISTNLKIIYVHHIYCILTNHFLCPSPLLKKEVDA